MLITILGAGRSGVAAAKLAKSKGYTPFLSEYNDGEKYDSIKNELKELGIDYEFGGHDKEKILKSDLVISSPGIKPNLSIIKQIEDSGIDIIDENEFAYQFLDSPIIAVTGTNGKTTTVNLIYHLLKCAKKDVVLAGNIGMPLSAQIDSIKKDTIIVLELSSFQLERTKRLKPDVAIFLNITEDHLDWHGNMEAYFDSKWKITASQNEDNLLVLNYDNKNLIRYAFERGQNSKATKAAFSTNSIIQSEYPIGVIAVENTIRYFEQHGESQLHEEDIMPIEELSLPGSHNLYNSMAAILAAKRFQVKNEDIRDALSSFKGVEHRLEHVLSLNGIQYVNDSKATNINSAWFALSSYKKPIVWIAGGKSSGNDYSQLDDFVQSNVKSIIAIGEDQDNIFNHFAAMKTVKKADSMKEAIQQATDQASVGEIVLFSPACKSFDMYTNFEERGQEFKKEVNSLVD